MVRQTENSNVQNDMTHLFLIAEDVVVANMPLAWILCVSVWKLSLRISMISVGGGRDVLKNDLLLKKLEFQNEKSFWFQNEKSFWFQNEKSFHILSVLHGEGANIFHPEIMWFDIGEDMLND